MWNRKICRIVKIVKYKRIDTISVLHEATIACNGLGLTELELISKVHWELLRIFLFMLKLDILTCILKF